MRSDAILGWTFAVMIAVWVVGNVIEGRKHASAIRRLRETAPTCPACGARPRIIFTSLGLYDIKRCKCSLADWIRARAEAPRP